MPRRLGEVLRLGTAMVVSGGALCSRVVVGRESGVVERRKAGHVAERGPRGKARALEGGVPGVKAREGWGARRPPNPVGRKAYNIV